MIAKLLESCIEMNIVLILIIKFRVNNKIHYN